jgi:outer membrane lipoprotein-sorting protein
MQPRRSGLKYLLLCALMAALAAGRAPGATPAAARSTPARLSAQQIVAKNVAARGGLEAWRRVQTMVWTGHIESARASLPSVLFTLSLQRPNKMRFEMNAMRERSLRVFDGTHGWKLRPAQGRADVQPYSPDELRFEQSGPGLDGPLIDSADKGSSVSVVGLDEIEKHKAYHLIVRTAAGESQHVWVDTKTFLETRYDRPAEGPTGSSRMVSVVYRDYRATEGLMIPSIIETGVAPGTPPDRMVIERVVLNPPLSEQSFRNPAQHSMRDRVPFPSHQRRPLPDGVLPSPLSSPPQPTPPGSAPLASPLPAAPAGPTPAPPANPTPAPANAPGASGEDRGSASQ